MREPPREPPACAGGVTGSASPDRSRLGTSLCSGACRSGIHRPLRPELADLRRAHPAARCPGRSPRVAADRSSGRTARPRCIRRCSACRSPAVAGLPRHHDGLRGERRQTRPKRPRWINVGRSDAWVELYDSKRNAAASTLRLNSSSSGSPRRRVRQGQGQLRPGPNFARKAPKSAAQVGIGGGAIRRLPAPRQDEIQGALPVERCVRADRLLRISDAVRAPRRAPHAAWWRKYSSATRVPYEDAVEIDLRITECLAHPLEVERRRRSRCRSARARRSVRGSRGSPAGAAGSSSRVSRQSSG